MSDRKGEGSYDGAEKFREEQHEFAEKGDVKGKAREAANAVDGPEGEELEKAARKSAKGKHS